MSKFEGTMTAPATTIGRIGTLLPWRRRPAALTVRPAAPAIGDDGPKAPVFEGQWRILKDF